MHGALVFFVSLDVRRYLPVVKCLAVLSVFFGCGMLVLDIAVGLPPGWIAGEGPSIIVLGGLSMKERNDCCLGAAPVRCRSFARHPES